MVSITDYVSVREQACKLGCRLPGDLALLPRNFRYANNRNALVHERDASTIRKLWRQAGISETRLEPDTEEWPEVHEHTFEWIGPTVFVGASLLSGNPSMVALALNVIGNFVTDLFKGVPSSHRTAKMSIVVECPGGRCRKVDYEGPPEGLSELPKILREVTMNE